MSNFVMSATFRHFTPTICAAISCKNRNIVGFSKHLAFCETHIKMFSYQELVKYIKIKAVVL